MAPKAKKKTKAKPKVKPKRLSAAEEEARNKILQDFREFDLNGDGVLQRGELKALLQVLDPSNWTDESVERLVIAFDKDEDGDISLEEFVDWITGARADADNESFRETLEKSRTDVAAMNRKHVQQELEHLKGTSISAEVQKISWKDLEIVAEVAAPSEPLQRLLSLVWLLLQPSTTKASGRPVNFKSPAWSAVQHLLRDSSFLQRVCRTEERHKEMTVTHSLVAARAVEQYFLLPESGDEEEHPSPLSYSILFEAIRSYAFGSKAGPIMILYKWCLALLEANLRRVARDEHRERAVIDFQQAQERENTEKLEAAKADADALLGELDDLLAEM